MFPPNQPINAARLQVMATKSTGQPLIGAQIHVQMFPPGQPINVARLQMMATKFTGRR